MLFILNSLTQFKVIVSVVLSRLMIVASIGIDVVSSGVPK